jgi:hypothetical protein
MIGGEGRTSAIRPLTPSRRSGTDGSITGVFFGLETLAAPARGDLMFSDSFGMGGQNAPLNG